MTDYRQTSLDLFIAGYLTCAEWTDCSPDHEAEGLSHDFEAQATLDCMKFYSEWHASLLLAVSQDGYTWERAGHDFWLNRNGHGAGYWCRNELPLALRERLSRASHKAGEREAYEHNGELYPFC